MQHLDEIIFIDNLPEYTSDLYIQKKMKTNEEIIKQGGDDIAAKLWENNKRFIFLWILLFWAFDFLLP